MNEDPTHRPSHAPAAGDDRHANPDAATLQALLQGVRDYAIYTLDPAGVITAWYAGAERMLGYTAPEVIGQPVSRLFTPADVAAGLPALGLRRAAEQGEHTADAWQQRQDGRTLPVALVWTALRSPQGMLLGFLALTRDVSARQAEAAARERALHDSQLARQEAERASRLKGEFLATLSHELRTPLSAILGWAHALENGAFDAGTLQHGLEAISRNARLQVQLIDDLLDMTRIESGQLRLDLQRVELDGVLAAAMDAVLPVVAARGLTLTPRFPPPPACWVLGDPARLQQVVAHLLSNAIKFTPRGGQIELSLVHDDQRACVCVADSGQGIAPEFLGRLFERFRQQDATTTRRHGGLGIGLALVRELVRMHGGEVRAESEGLGRGARFTVCLPLAPEAAAVPHARPTRAPLGGRLSGVGVLVVEDEPDVRAVTARLLQSAGAEVAQAATADEALQLLRQRRPDVLLSDIGMAGCDGYALIRQVRALPPEAGGRTPAAAFTAFAGREDAERARAAGYQRHLAKPVPPEALLAAVQALAAGRGSVEEQPDEQQHDARNAE